MHAATLLNIVVYAWCQPPAGGDPAEKKFRAARWNFRHRPCGLSAKEPGGGQRGADLHYPAPVLQEDEQLADEGVQVRRQQVLVAVLAEVHDRCAGVRLHKGGLSTRQSAWLPASQD